MKSNQLSMVPKRIDQAREMPLISNFYQFKFTNPSRQKIQKYSVKFEPSIPDNSKKVRNKVVNKVRKDIEKQLGFFLFLGNSAFSLEGFKDVQTYQSEFEEVQYLIEIQWVNEIHEKDKD